MDARITKQRLANMLSYDWLKIVGAIALAAVFFSMFFTMIAARATAGQTFYVYAYDGVYAGGDFSLLEDRLSVKGTNGVFGYDILNTGSESFKKNNLYGDSVFTARRSAGEGRVMFVNDVRTTDEDGKEKSALLSFLDYEGTEWESFSLFLDPKVFMEKCKSYLESFFGPELKTLDREKARLAFMERNGKDNRFRSAAKKEQGVLLEEQRLEKLKTDYLLVSSALGQSLDYVTYTSEQKTHTVGFSMSALNLTSLVYYITEREGQEVQENSGIALCIFNNGEREGDLIYETVNFVAYLLREYGTEK